MKKHIFSLLAILGAVIHLTACQQQNKQNELSHSTQTQAMHVNIISVKKQILTPTLILTGSTIARDDVAIGTSLTGQKITAVFVEVGQRVQKGQILARLDNVNVQSQLQQNEMALSKAKANLNARQAEWREANATFQRYQQLINASAISQLEFDQQRLKVESAHANIQTAQAEIAQIQSQITDSKHQRNKAEIVAPANGIISQKTAEVGALAGSDPLFHLIKDGEMELSAQANADELARLAVGMPAQIRIRGNQQIFSGSVRVISPQMDTSNRLGKVLISIDEMRGNANPIHIPNGAFGEVAIQLPSHTLSMALPMQAVSFLDNGQAFVMSVSKPNNQIKRQTVQIGQQFDDWIEIVSGVNVGDEVVKNASAFVNDGDVITPVRDERPNLEQTK